MTSWFAVLAAALAAAPDATIQVDAGQVLNRTTPLMYGSCIEDVNHEIYGGLYAQQIFGESFEEPPRFAPPGWTDYSGRWSTKDGVCSVKADAGAKLLRTEPTFADGAVECDVQITGGHGDNAGLLVRVQQPHVGADAFLGYEISLSAKNGSVLLGRHRNDWKLLKEVPAAIKSGRWHHLRVECSGKDLAIFLDGDKTPLLKYTDAAAPHPFGPSGPAHVECRRLISPICRRGGRQTQCGRLRFERPDDRGGGERHVGRRPHRLGNRSLHLG